MRRLIIFIFSFLIILGGCKDKMHVPKKIIQPDKMGLILWDMISAQYLAEYRADSDSLINKESETNALTSKVFQTHKITPAAFDKSYNWYVEHPVILKTILDSLHVQKQREFDEESTVGNEEIHGPATKRLRRNDAAMEKAIQ